MTEKKPGRNNKWLLLGALVIIVLFAACLTVASFVGDKNYDYAFCKTLWSESLDFQAQYGLPGAGTVFRNTDVQGCIKSGNWPP